MDLPEIEDIRRVTYNPDDVIVVRLQHRGTAQAVQQMVDHLREAFPTQKIVVLDPSVGLDVVTPA